MRGKEEKERKGREKGVKERRTGEGERKGRERKERERREKEKEKVVKKIKRATEKGELTLNWSRGDQSNSLVCLFIQLSDCATSHAHTLTRVTDNEQKKMYRPRC